MPPAMIRDTNDGKKWSTLDKRDLADVLKGGGDIEEAATFLCRAGTVGEVAHTAAELGLLTDADAKYSVELFSDLGGLERELARKDQLEPNLNSPAHSTSSWWRNIAVGWSCFATAAACSPAATNRIRCRCERSNHPYHPACVLRTHVACYAWCVTGRSRQTDMTKVLRKKRGRATTGQDQVTALRLPLELKSKVGAWANRQDDKPSLSEAIHRLVEKALAGTIPRQPSKGARKATEMAARELDRVLGDQPATGEERANRKRRLLSGPKEFRDMRRK
jgi:hypothetical protein